MSHPILWMATIREEVHTMARSIRAARRSTAAQAKTETTEATIPEAKVLVEATTEEQFPNPEVQPTEEELTDRMAVVFADAGPTDSDAPEAYSEAPSETGSAAEAAETTVQDLQEAARAEGEAPVAEEAPPMGLSKSSWIVPGPCTKRAGTDAWRSFQCYGEGCTVEDYLSAKGHSSRRKARESLRWDVQRGLVKVLEARPVAEESSGEGAAPSEKEAVAA